MKKLDLAVALVAGLALSAAGFALDNAPARSTEGGSGDIQDGTLAAEAVNGCYILATGTITTSDVGGTVSAWFNVWDDGNFLHGHELPVPGDGATHPWCYVYQVTAPVLQGAVGLGLYLEDGEGPAATTTFDSLGSFNDATDVCTGPAPVCPQQALAIPTMDRTGLVMLALLLGGVALWLVARRRAAGAAR